LRFNLIALADRLHITISEAEQMPLSEFHEWAAFYKIMSERNDDG